MRESQCKLWKSTLGFTGCFLVDCNGKSGGLALLWKDPLDVCIKSFSVGHIDCIVSDADRIWRFTGFYGQPEATLRHFSWDLLLRLRGIVEFLELPWLVGGDFNEICFDSEKKGGIRRAPSRMQAFRDALDLCELQSLHCLGDVFTWVNRRAPENIIFERLDRYVGNLKWRLIFPAAQVSSLEFYHSDHRPLYLQLNGDQSHYQKKVDKQQAFFRFEKYWLLEKECGEIVKEGWGARTDSRTVQERLLRCKNALGEWSNTRLRGIPKKLKELRKELNNLRTSWNWSSSSAQVQRVEDEVEKLATQDELYWRQRSRISWLKDGDRNSHFFHNAASRRRVQNTINGLVSSHGDWCTSKNGMAAIVLEYFKILFTTGNPSAADMMPILDTITPAVDEQMNSVLCAPFTAVEIRRALFDLHPDKAPGLDGMSALFYQKFWHIVGEDITTAVLQILNNGAPIDQWNEALVTLIPKSANPLLMKEFRPISLCNICYKIVARALTNRLRKVMSKLIDESQSAFIPGRMITDNIIVGFETIHWMRTRKAGRVGYAALKLDMSKAYDRVEWDFLQAVLMRLGFALEWVDKIMRCVRTVKYFFRINQDVVGPITPSRGLRQGDPLSPYLFVLCAHGLSRLLTDYESRGLIRGVRIAPSCPVISHLFFADDSLVFFRATMEDGARVKECLQLYERASGQMINYEKSALSFSPNTNPLAMETIKSILTIPVVQRHELYLGLPTVSLQSKRLQFKYIVERVVKRIQGWDQKYFSTGGKETLIKSVIQAIPTYAMNCFKIPKAICYEIERECANFWWGKENGRRKIHWRNWELMCKPKMKGGMGFRKMEDFNRALLAKQLWRLIRHPESLVSQVLKGRYFKHGNVMEASLGSNPSYIWRSILWSREILEKGLLWRVGDGKSIKIFTDKWIPSMESIIGVREDTRRSALTVDSLIKDGTWDVEQINNVFNTWTAGEILKIPLSSSQYQDMRFWRFDKKGKYSVRDGYRLQQGLFTQPENCSVFTSQSWWTFLWSLNLPPKVRIFWWHLSHDIIPTNLNLLRHHVPINGACVLCHNNQDTTCHSLFFCEPSKKIWKGTGYYHIMRLAKKSSTSVFCGWMQNNLSREEFEKFAIQAWAIWKERQLLIHDDSKHKMADEVYWSLSFLTDFQKAKNLELQNGLVPRELAEYKWKQPAPGTVKLNVDACVKEQSNRYSIGGALRDCQGRLLLAFGKQITEPLSVVHGELLAIREGVKLIYEQRFQNVLVASDSVLAVQAVKAVQDDLGYTGICATEISLMAHAPVISDIVYEPRLMNKVAHKVANFASSSPSPFVWVNGEFPSWLVEVVMNEYSQ